MTLNKSTSVREFLYIESGEGFGRPANQGIIAVGDGSAIQATGSASSRSLYANPPSRSRPPQIALGEVNRREQVLVH